MSKFSHAAAAARAMTISSKTAVLTNTYRILGKRILLMPPSLTLILRHKLESVCGVVLFTFLA